MISLKIIHHKPRALHKLVKAHLNKQRGSGNVTVDAHIMTRHLTEVVVTPEHANRTESAEFRRAKARLKADGHYHCWVCGATKNLQVHHYGLEWSLANLGDFAKLKEFCEEWDPYGYGRLLKNKPITSADDIRNMLVLCQEHHTGVDHADGNSGTGIHSLTFPVFIIQKLAKQGKHLIPHDGEKPQQVLKEMESYELSHP